MFNLSTKFWEEPFYILLYMAFKIYILGSSAAIPTEKRGLSAQVLQLNQRNYLIDCGEGTQFRLKDNGLKMSRIDHVFISHLHGDHYFGLIGLMFSMHLMGRKKPLNIFAPEEIRDIIQIQLDVAGSVLSYEWILHPHNFSKPKLILDSKVLRVESIPLEHRIPTCGFVFREKSKERNISRAFLNNQPGITYEEIKAIKAGSDYRAGDGRFFANQDITYEAEKPASYAYVSDTRYFEGLCRQIGAVDVMYHEATFADHLEDQAFEKMHATARQAARQAKACHCSKLLLGHISARYKDDAGALQQQARSVFPESVLVEDGDVFDI